MQGGIGESLKAARLCWARGRAQGSRKTSPAIAGSLRGFKMKPGAEERFR